MNDLIGTAFALVVVGLVLFGVAMYLLEPRNTDQGEDLRFHLDDYRSDRDGEE